MNFAKSRFHRILNNGTILALDRKKYFLMADEVVDSENITGQQIPVWGNILINIELYIKTKTNL